MLCFVKSYTYFVLPHMKNNGSSLITQLPFWIPGLSNKITLH
jgi:hypothetical protein